MAALAFSSILSRSSASWASHFTSWFTNTTPRPMPTTCSHGSTSKNHFHQNWFLWVCVFLCVLEMKRKRNGETYGACKGVFGERWSTSGSPAPIELRSLLRSKPFLSLSLSLSLRFYCFFFFLLQVLFVFGFYNLVRTDEFTVHHSHTTWVRAMLKHTQKTHYIFFFFFTYHYNCHISHYKNFCQMFFRLFLYELILF